MNDTYQGSMGVSVNDRSHQTVDSSETGWFSKCFDKKPSDDDNDTPPHQGCACHAQSSTRKMVLKIQQHTATLKQQRGQLVKTYAVYWDVIVALLAMLGFIIGSVFFIPFIEQNYAPAKHIGEYLFAIASVLILYLNVQDLCKVLRSSSSSRNNENHKVVKASEITVTTRSLEGPYEPQHPETTRQQDGPQRDTLAAVLNSIGSLLFTIGSFLFIWFPLSGGWCFILGSVSFVVGAFVHSFQIWTAPDRIAAQMATTMVLLETTGFTMFFVASLPYGFTFECTGDGLYTGAAVCYVLGSILCFVTCALDIRRLQYIKETQQACR